ncbi:hypothetical protein D3C72_1346560 [compost metagenome]
MAMPQNHKTAKRHLTKNEFKLFQNSLPKNLHGLSERRVKIAHKNTQDLIKKYRKGLKSAATESKQEKINMRLRNLEQILDRYSRNMKTANAAEESSGRRSLTDQPKMRLNRRRGGAEQGRLYMERNKIYPMHHEEPHVEAKSIKAKSKRKKRTH